MDFGKSLDFEVEKETWGKYNLSDGSILKTRFLLTSIRRKKELNNKMGYETGVQNFQNVLCDSHLIGEPDTAKYSNEMLNQNMEADDVRFDVLESPSNIYILEDGTKIKIFPQVLKISRSKLKNKFGEPIYMINNNLTINFEKKKV